MFQDSSSLYYLAGGAFLIVFLYLLAKMKGKPGAKAKGQGKRGEGDPSLDPLASDERVVDKKMAKLSAKAAKEARKKAEQAAKLEKKKLGGKRPFLLGKKKGSEPEPPAPVLAPPPPVFVADQPPLASPPPPPPASQLSPPPPPLAFPPPPLAAPPAPPLASPAAPAASMREGVGWPPRPAVHPGATVLAQAVLPVAEAMASPILGGKFRAVELKAASAAGDGSSEGPPPIPQAPPPLLSMPAPPLRGAEPAPLGPAPPVPGARASAPAPVFSPQPPPVFSPKAAPPPLEDPSPDESWDDLGQEPPAAIGVRIGGTSATSLGSRVVVPPEVVPVSDSEPVDLVELSGPAASIPVPVSILESGSGDASAEKLIELSPLEPAALEPAAFEPAALEPAALEPAAFEPSPSKREFIDVDPAEFKDLPMAAPEKIHCGPDLYQREIRGLTGIDKTPLGETVDASNSASLDKGSPGGAPAPQALEEAPAPPEPYASAAPPQPPLEIKPEPAGPRAFSEPPPQPLAPPAANLAPEILDSSRATTQVVRPAEPIDSLKARPMSILESRGGVLKASQTQMTSPIQIDRTQMPKLMKDALSSGPAAGQGVTIQDLDAAYERNTFLTPLEVVYYKLLRSAFTQFLIFPKVISRAAVSVASRTPEHLKVAENVLTSTSVSFLICDVKLNIKAVVQLVDDAAPPTNKDKARDYILKKAGCVLVRFYGGDTPPDAATLRKLLLD
jgi:hypothetical protein